MKKLRVLVLVHEDFMAPESLEGLSDHEVARIKTEYDVIEALDAMGHQVEQLGISREELASGLGTTVFVRNAGEFAGRLI